MVLVVPHDARGTSDPRRREGARSKDVLEACGAPGASWAAVAEARLELRLARNGEEGAPGLEARLTVEGAVFEGTQQVRLGSLLAVAAEMEGILGRATLWSDPDLGSRELLRQRGELLFDLVLPCAVKAALRSLSGGPMHLVAPGELMGLPWELFHDGREFLGLAFALGRSEVGLEVGRQECGREPGELRALVVCDPRGDLINSYYEGLMLRDQLARPGTGVPCEVDLRSSEVGHAEVARLLRAYDLVHFAGHVEACGGSQRGWKLKDGELGPDAIRALSGGRSFPRFVFSNACRSAEQPDARPGEEVGGLARAFVQGGVAHYIGTVHDVPDEPAGLLSLAFYDELRTNPELGVGEALRRARLVLARQYGAESTYWAAWVLIGSPHGNPFAAQLAGGNAAVPGPESLAMGERGASLGPLGAQPRGVMATRAPLILTMELPAWRRALGLVLGGLLVAAAGLALPWLAGREHDAPGVRELATSAWAQSAMRAMPADVERVAAAPLPYHAPNRRLEADSEQAPAVRATRLPIGLGLVVRRAGPRAGQPPALRSGESFRLALTLPGSGYYALWHLESQGTLRRIAPEPSDGQGPQLLASAGAVKIPHGDKWFWLDHRTGTERFLLTWSREAPDDATLAAMLEGSPKLPGDEGLESMSRRLESLLHGEQAARPRLELRGLGGERTEPREVEGEVDALVEAMRNRLRAVFDEVAELAVEHR